MEKKIKIDKDLKRDELHQLIHSEDLPKFYANGFLNFHGNADMGIVFQTNGKPVALVNLSFTMAKTLASKLNQMVVEFEEMTKNTIMTTEDIEEKQRGEK